MGVLNITPRERMTDREGRPYFAWDTALTLAEFESRLRDPDPAVRAYFLGKLMRQARPDDVFAFVTTREIAERWPDVVPHLGDTRRFWSWLLHAWGALGDDRG